MLDWTDRHERYFLRIISQHTLLYTEMVTAQAILRGDRERHLAYSPQEHPLALQLGGSEPEELAECASIAAEYGYDEINLNVGCPSARVKSGSFGACLMASPDIVAECVAAMAHAVPHIPITVKHRIGIDALDSYELLHGFVETVAASGCETFIVHARKAWLSGLSPKQNREVPPLRYELVYRLKRDFPWLKFVINGGIHNLQQAEQLIQGEDHATPIEGAMIGREAYHNPYILHDADQRFYDSHIPIKKRTEIVTELLDYIRQHSQQRPVHDITRHILGLFHGLPGAKSWRRQLSNRAEFEPAWEKILTERVLEFERNGY